MNNDNNSFSYTYSSAEQREVQKIVNKYDPQENKIEALKRLDKSVSAPGQAIALIMGIIGILIFGTGMCFCLDTLVISFMSSMAFGIIVASIGTIFMLSAYPIYSVITNSRKKRLAPEIIRLSNEILGK